MAMASIITLSSSPTPTFARSPTPVRFSSSPSKDSHDPTKVQHDSQQCFKPAQVWRDGFPEGFKSARQVLGLKSNVPPLSLRRTQSHPGDQNTVAPSAKCPLESTIVAKPLPRHIESATVDSRKSEASDKMIVKILPSDVRRKKKVQKFGDLELERAVPRRKDWTPPKSNPAFLEKCAPNESGFGMDLARLFGNVSCDLNFEETQSTVDGIPTKRRRTGSLPGASHLLSNNKHSLVQNDRVVAKSRKKSPAKKSLTITGLTTSHYLEDRQGRENDTLMMQFLASTQARMQSEGNSDHFETRVDRRPAKSKKIRSKSKLDSPKTGMRALRQQDFIFASASQLASDEHPAVLRDLVEAIRESETDFLSDPVFTQQTAPFSTDSAPPKTGISRFLSRRNLWNAAHRDQDDALLHQDDPFDDPRVRAALIDTDALFEHTGPLQNSTNLMENCPDILPALQRQAITTYDINDITAPSFSPKSTSQISAVRLYSTSTKSPSSKRTKEVSGLRGESQNHLRGTSQDPQKSKIPPKPNYANWTDEDLKKQVQEYGFKRIRARKTMIDKLDECWAQKYGLDPAAVKAATKAASRTVTNLDHGHFLSNVHELASRPAPKAKKVRTKRRNGDSPNGVSKPKSKGRLVKLAENTMMVKDDIVDLEDIDTPTAFDRLASIHPFADDPIDSLEPSTAPVKGTGVKATVSSKVERKSKARSRLPTPPPTLSENTIPQSSPGFESPQPVPVNASPAVTPQTTGADQGLKFWILEALLCPPVDARKRNHQENPTWHEKMLLYDPIVLEDFTAWLNTEGFNAIGVDDEIDVADVKEWCEENGICCLWRGGWGGNNIKE